MSRLTPDSGLEGSDPTDEAPAFAPEAALDEASPTAVDAAPRAATAPARDDTTDGTPVPDDTAPHEALFEPPLGSPSWADDATVSLQANELAADLLESESESEFADDPVDSTLVEVDADQRPLAAELLGPAGTADDLRAPGETPWAPVEPAPPALDAIEVTDEDVDLEETPRQGAPTVPLRPPPRPADVPGPTKPLDAVAYRRSSTPIPQAPSLSLPETAAPERPMYQVPEPAPHVSAQRYAPTSARRAGGGRGWLLALAAATVVAGAAVGWMSLAS